MAVGTSDAATASTLTYSNNGMLATLKDGENNLTTFVYDGFDRLSQTQYPNPTKGSGTSNASDYEQLTYDANSNVTQRRLRDATTIGFTYDNLNRVTVKGPPNPEATMTYGYDNLNRLTSANKGGLTLSFTYDALGRNLTQVSPQGTVTSTWDAAGRRTQLTYPGTGLYLNYDYLLTGEVTKVRENGATSGIGVLASYGYDDLGNRTSAAYGNGTAQAFGYDPVSRLSSLTVDLAGTASDLTKTFAYNPASQIVTETRSNDAYAQVLANGTQTSLTNGLNQLATVNGTAAAYDARGNMTTDPATGKTYTYYGSNNQLYTVPSPYTVFSYDALDRLASFNTGAPVTNYVSDGNTPIAEYDGSNVLQKRYAFGPGGPLVAYDASGNRTWMVGDERGSVIALASDSGAMTSIDTYDEYGIPGASNAGTFQYAGMLWLSRPGLYAPTYRAYGAHLGRFSQTDPVGYRSGPNIYNYVLGDPVNLVDPLGLDVKLPTGVPQCQTAAGCPPPPPPPPDTPTGTRIPGGISPQLFGSVGGGTVGFPVAVSVTVSYPSTGGLCENRTCTDLIVTAPQIIYIPGSSFGEFAQADINPYTDLPEYHPLEDIGRGLSQRFGRLVAHHNQCVAQANQQIDPESVGRIADLGEFTGEALGSRFGRAGTSVGGAIGATVGGGAALTSQFANSYFACMGG